MIAMICIPSSISFAASATMSASTVLPPIIATYDSRTANGGRSLRRVQPR
jgi:hypothetical protein